MSYAHSIKNPHIIHMVEKLKDNESTYLDNRYRYLCNQAVGPTPSKSTTDPSKVTCKNCLREMSRK